MKNLNQFECEQIAGGVLEAIEAVQSIDLDALSKLVSANPSSIIQSSSLAAVAATKLFSGDEAANKVSDYLDIGEVLFG